MAAIVNASTSTKLFSNLTLANEKGTIDERIKPRKMKNIVKAPNQKTCAATVEDGIVQVSLLFFGDIC